MASFSGSSFEIVPDFRYSKFDRPPEVANMKMARPRLSHDPKAQADILEKGKENWQRSIQPSLRIRPFKTALDKQDVARYRQLKSMAEAASDHEKAGEFFSYEMMAKRGSETITRSGMIFNELYWRLSDFGQSFTKPILGIVWLWAVFAFYFICAIASAMPLAKVGDCFETLLFAGFLSLQNAFPFAKGIFRFTAKPTGSNGWFDDTYKHFAEKGGLLEWLFWPSLVQGMLGTILLFLFLLALRNRFRLK